MFAYLSAHLSQLIQKGDSVLMAISGGPDSMAMAEILCRYINKAASPTECISLAAVHINHGLRQEADAEEEQVRVFAQQWGLPLFVHRFDAKSYAQSVGKPLQEAAREWRYTCFAEEMQKRRITSLATAHHLNDQAETLLYRFLRGSGTVGLSGIWPDRLEKGWGSGEAGEPLRIIRPLLTVTKEDILAYCHERGIDYAQDLSNKSIQYTRNRIRLQLIPQLEQEYNPRLQKVLSHTAEVLRWDEMFFQSVIADKWQLYGYGTQCETAVLLRAAWQEPPAILSRLLRSAMALVRGDPRGVEHRFVKGLMEASMLPGWSQDLPGIRVTASEEQLLFLNKDWLETQRQTQKDPLAAEDYWPDLILAPNKWKYIPETQDDNLLRDSMKKKIGLFSEERAKGILQSEPSVQKISQVLLNTATLQGCGGPIEYRKRRPGDKIYLAGIGHKHLKKIWQEQSVPASQRDGIKILAVGSLVLAIPLLHIVGQPKTEEPTARWDLLLTETAPKNNEE